MILLLKADLTVFQLFTNLLNPHIQCPHKDLENYLYRILIGCSIHSNKKSHKWLLIYDNLYGILANTLKIGEEIMAKISVKLIISWTLLCLISTLVVLTITLANADRAKCFLEKQDAFGILIPLLCVLLPLLVYRIITVPINPFLPVIGQLTAIALCFALFGLLRLAGISTLFTIDNILSVSSITGWAVMLLILLWGPNQILVNRNRKKLKLQKQKIISQ